MSDPKKFQWGHVLTISLAHGLHDIFSSFFAPLLPLLKVKLGLSNSDIGILSVVQRLPSLFNPLVGIMADKFPVRYFVIVSPAITAIVMSLIGLAPGIVILGILLFVMGISSTLFHTPSPVMIKKVSGDKPGKGMSFYMLGGEFARTLGPLIITAAVSYWGLEGIWKLIPFGLVASFVLFLQLRKIPIAKDIQKPASYSSIGKTLRETLPFFLILAGFIFFRGIAKGALTTFLTIYLDEQGQSLWFVNGALSIFQFTGALGVVVSGTLSDKLGRRTILITIAIVTPILMGLFMLADDFWQIPVLMLLGFFILSTGPVLLALVNRIKTSHPAFLNGVFMTVSFAVGAFAILLTGIMGDLLGLEQTFRIAAVLSAGSIVFALLMAKWDK
ncbi:MAG: MFS transporter [Bacteroidales bacterium]|nr:MFS transporter [Bacteroidales bacterium]MCF8454947.1 MFS transporter [Bacteroidales bacterium]